jgi:hypothetical protein
VCVVRENAFGIVSRARWIYLSTSHANAGRAWKARPMDGVTSAEINPFPTRNNTKCNFSHDTHRKGEKIPFLHEISLNIVQHHDKSLMSDIGAQKVVLRMVVFIRNFFRFLNTKLIDL